MYITPSTNESETNKYSSPRISELRYRDDDLFNR